MMRVIVGSAQQSASHKTSAASVPREELKWEQISAQELLVLASTPMLFGGPRTLVLRGALVGERGEEFLDAAQDLVQSPHTFIFEEDKLLKAPTTALQKAGAKIEVVKAEKKERGFDPFGLTFALGARDKKKLWLGLVQALGAGEKPEAIAGLLAWKVRSLLSEARAAGKYTRDELKNLSREIIFLYHDSHRGAGDLELLLERFALQL